MRILVADDEVKLAQVLADTLKAEAYAVDVVHDGVAAEEAILAETYDLVVLDLGLPKKDGMDVCRTVRKEGSAVPILMLTARDASRDKIGGLNTGADDYVVKPFDLDELLARIRSLIRRSAGITQDVITVADLVLDRAIRQLKRAGQTIELTAKEYALIDYLLCHAGSIVTKEEILAHVWDMNTDPFTKVVDVYMGYLRAKIDKAFPKKPPLITTVKGMGYKVGV